MVKIGCIILAVLDIVYYAILLTVDISKIIELELYTDIPTVRKTLFCTLCLDCHFSIKTWPNLNSNGSFEQLRQFCVQNCPWKLNLVKN